MADVYEVRYEPFRLEGIDGKNLKRVLRRFFETDELGGVLFSVSVEEVERIENILDEKELTERERVVLEALRAEAKKRGGAFDLILPC